MQATLRSRREAKAEDRLIEDARAGVSSAWSELYRRYFMRMYTYAYTRIGDRPAAEDIAAQVFLDAWKGIGSFQNRGIPISAWLYRIAHNLSADFLRRRSRIKFEPLEAGERSRQAADGGHEDAVATRQEVIGALRCLTREQQQVVVMRFVEGMSRAEVCAATGKSEEAVKALQHRALSSLRRHLQKTRERKEV